MRGGSSGIESGPVGWESSPCKTFHAKRDDGAATMTDKCDRVNVQLTASAVCPRCKGRGIKTVRDYHGELRFGGPPQPHTGSLALCDCVQASSTSIHPGEILEAME